MTIEICPKCGTPTMDIMLASNPPIPKKICTACGWSWTGKPETVEHKQFEAALNDD